MADEKKENTDIKQQIKDIINREIKNNKSDLAQVKSCIERKFRRSLGTIDDDYIERKYIKYCLKAWLDETTHFLKTLTASQSRNVIQEILNSANKMQNLKEIPNSFKQRELYLLLIKHHDFFKEPVEETAITRFKKVCFEQIISHNNSVEKELVFLEAFVQFLNSSKNLLSIIAELKFGDVHCGKLEFSKLLLLITNLNVSTYGESLEALQEAVQCLQLEGSLLLMDEFKEIIGAYIEPVQVQEKEMDNRSVIEVSGMSIVISKILKQVETRLENPEIEEVHFIAAHTVHIDANIEGTIWQGRNIVLKTKLIQIHNKATWNVSGRDNNHNYTDDAGTGEDGHGKQGNDGYPGESGGNVLILADEIKNPENLTIVSNGGKGSKGQDGGNGMDGTDGKGITVEEFEKKFPPVAFFALQFVLPKLKTTIVNIERNIEDMKIEWYYKTFYWFGRLTESSTTFNENVIEKIKEDMGSGFSGNIFIKGMTDQGNEITFSFSGVERQAYLLYKGSLGKPGVHGGEYGFGGEGGYPGEIAIRNLENKQEFKIEGICKQGEEGKKGQGGLYGNHGKNGWDMGYMDYGYENWFTEDWPKHFGKDQSSKLSLYNDGNSSSSNVWCSYKEEYVNISASRIEHKKQRKYEERKNMREHSDRQHQAQAIRKKGISTKAILSNYSHHFSSMAKSTLQNLRSEIESTQQRAFQVFANQNQEQQDMQSVQLGIRRNIYFIDRSKNERIHNTINSTSYAMNIKQKVKELFEELLNEQLLSDKWFEVKCVELSIFQLSQLFDALNTKIAKEHESQDDNKLKCIETLLIDKYRLATLQEIGRQLPRHQKITDKTELTAQTAVRYLVEEKKKDNKIFHATLGFLNPYLYQNRKEQRENIVTFCEESESQLPNSMKETLKRSIEAYVFFEVQESEKAYEPFKKYCTEFKVFVDKKTNGKEDSYAKFHEELVKSKHDQVYTLWMDYLSGNKSVKFELEEKIHANNDLRSLYQGYNDQLNLEYDWSECYKDLAFLKNYNECIRQKGSLSKCYRELLAHIFNVNIRLYAKDKQNLLSLQDNHNPSSENVIYVLNSVHELIQLELNENYFVLEAQRKENGKLYGKILREIEGLAEKQDFDDYLKNKTYLFDDNDPESNQHFNQEEYIEQIIEYFPEEEQQQLRSELEKTSSNYVVQKVIFHHVLQRFSSDGRHVSGQELCSLIDSILTSEKDDRKEQNTFCWIIAAHSQRNWTDELILLQLENHFKKQLEETCKWQEYLSKIGSKEVLLLFGAKFGQGDSISTECIDGIFRFLSYITNATVSLDELKLSEWPYVLKEKYWLSKLLSLTNWPENEKLPTASYYLLSMENIFGVDLVEQLLEALNGKLPAPTPYVLTNILAQFQNGKWNLSEEEISFLITNDIGKWEDIMQKKFTAAKEERNITQLIDLINGNANTSKNILNKLPKVKFFIESIQENSKMHANSIDNSAQKLREKIAIHYQTFLINKDKPDIEKDMLALVDRAIELKRGFKLRDTQKLAILALLVNEENTLAQVSTGEGKSLIVVAAAIIKAYFKQKVDIITSSSVLAKRDAEENKDIYGLFKIKVSHNCSEDIEERKQAYSGNQVVYGELSNFQRDYLLDKFYGKNILGDRNFENVIVDEVDSMLLDRGNNMLYLSHDLAFLDKLESVYIFIWQWINQPAWDEKEISQAFNVEAIEEAVLSDLFGFVRKEELIKLGHELSEQQTNKIWTSLVDAQILDDQGKLLKDNIDDVEFNKIISPETTSYKDRLKHLFTEVIERERRIHIPNHLRSFVERQLKSWIKSAKIAFSMKPGQDYVVDVDRTGTSSDRNPNIVILDRDTGTDQANSQWDNALHQFLQLKHGCRMSLQSLKAVFISNVSYFKLYRKLYGLTGTLGSQIERKLLQEIHNVDFVTVPTFISKQFDEHSPILCSDENAWSNQIRNEVNKLTKTSERSVLIICETVNDVEVLYEAFGGRSEKTVHMYKRDYEEFDVADDKKNLEQGQIIIATNLAGRGTDIKPSEGLRNAGGLHVCLTYLPANIRIEQQAFGRAARKGDKGSGQLIIMDSKGQEYSSSRVIDLKKKRDAEELYRVSAIKVYYETQITMEEKCFKLFKEQYERLVKNLENKKVPTEIKETLIKSCLDQWAYWLDENSEGMGTLIDEQSKNGFFNKLKIFITQFKQLENSNNFSPWVEGNPAEMIKLAKCLSQTKELTDAIKLFDEVIEMEPFFSEAAHYYKAFTLLKQIDRRQSILSEADKSILKEFKEELRKAARLFYEHIKFSTNAAGIIGNIKKKNTESIIQINAFEEQQKSVSSLYAKLSRSIDDILGHTIDPQSFVNADVNEDLAETILKDLLKNGVITNLRVEKDIPKKELKAIHSGYGLSADSFSAFISKHGGKEIIQKEFYKVLKTEVPLPSRETFWKMLIDGKFLYKEIKYVAVDVARLEDINPSLLQALIMLEKQSLNLKDGQILLNAEYVSQQQSNGNVFTKDDFIKSVGEDKYKLLKEKGVLSFNRKARLDHSQIKSITFPYYDSITLEDFTKVNITKNEAEQILAKLVEKKVVEKKENNAYKLRLIFDEIKEFSFPPYQNAVKGLLSVCFAFRIELQRIEKQLKEKDCPIRLQIKTKPHRDLFWDLYERNIITPSMVTTEDEGLEDKLKRIYSLKMTKKDFKLMLSQDKLISEECTEKLYHCLVEKKWIVDFSPIQRSQNASAERQVDRDIFSLCAINSPDKRQTPLNFSPDGKILSKSQRIDKEVEKVLDTRLCLSKTETIKNIVTTLKRSRSVLSNSKMPSFQLKPLPEFGGQKDVVNIEDMHVLSLNALGDLIQPAGEKWTFKMLLNTAVVAVMGIAQIAIGFALTLFSLGIIHKVGGALIHEGIGDLNFAVGALKSGYFSWKDYGQYKIRSLMNSATTAGLGAYLSRRSNVSGFGHRLAGSSFLIGSNQVAERFEKNPISTTEKILAKRVTQQAAEGVSFALNNAGTDTFIENTLQALSGSVVSTILSHISQVVERHNISKTLEKAYNSFGEESTRELNNLAKSFMTENNWEQKLSPIANILRKSVVQGIEKAVEKGSKSNPRSEVSSQIINISTVWKERVSHLANIKSTTGNFLNDLDKKINEKLDSQQAKSVDPGQNRKRCEELKREITNQLKNLLCAEAERVISQRIASPILSEGAKMLVKHAEKKSQKAFRSNQESGYFEQFEERKREYQDK